jgi:hypothetical protein
MGIKHRVGSDYCKFQILSKLSLSVQARNSEMPFVSYPRPINYINYPIKLTPIDLNGF